MIDTSIPINKMMTNQKMNLFIIDDDPLVLKSMEMYLTHRFGLDLAISTFSTGESALQMVDETTKIVILDYYLEGKNGNEVLKLIKNINPDTEVIMLSSNEDISLAIESFRNGAKDFVLKGRKSSKKISSIIYGIITYPIRLIEREFGISKYLAVFLVSFILIGICVLLSINLRY